MSIACLISERWTAAVRTVGGVALSATGRTFHQQSLSSVSPASTLVLLGTPTVAGEYGLKESNVLAASLVPSFIIPMHLARFLFFSELLRVAVRGREARALSHSFNPRRSRRRRPGCCARAPSGGRCALSADEWNMNGCAVWPVGAGRVQIL